MKKRLLDQFLIVTTLFYYKQRGNAIREFFVRAVKNSRRTRDCNRFDSLLR